MFNRQLVVAWSKQVRIRTSPHNSACSGYMGVFGRNGGDTAPYTVSPRRAAMMFLATSVATRTCASTVEAPRCGVAITLSCVSNCLKMA